MIYDDVGRHLEEAGSFDRAAVSLGVYLAWCANHDLLSDELMWRAADLVMRVRYRDVTGRELAVAGCGGELADEHLNEEGRAFTERCYEAYLAELSRATGGKAYDATDDWILYDRIAPWLTSTLMEFRGRSGRGGKRWWQIWK